MTSQQNAEDLEDHFKWNILISKVVKCLSFLKFANQIICAQKGSL